MRPLPEFDKLFVVSDLHMGGEAPYQIFRRGQLFADLVNSIRESADDEKVALLINGDLIDFLAEPDARCFDPAGAARKLQRIAADPSFSMVFAALRTFAASPHCRLIINLGNHDLELALPWVRDVLLEILSSPTAGASRVELVLDGSSYACAVGGKRVICLHGNEVDPWNVADYEMIRRIARDITQGRLVREWNPNAGSQLVIEVMNEIKRRYAFVDLLKPEDRTVVPILAALNEASKPRLRRIAAVAERLTWDALRRAAGFVTRDEVPMTTVLSGSGDEPGPTAAAEPVVAVDWDFSSYGTDASAIVAAAETNFDEGIDPVALAGNGVDTLSARAALVAWVRGVSPDGVVFAAIKELEKDRSFDLRAPDKYFAAFDPYIAHDYDYVIVGHTHMERMLRRRHGAGVFFNTGSWVPRIRFTPEMLASIHAFKPVFEILERSDTIDALEHHARSADVDLLMYRPIVFAVERGKPAELRVVDADGGNRVKFTPLS
jgi:UDP-2,3-diacylglucosamine pyrophosphatase LpxH